MKKILITGAEGFIGFNLAKYLVDFGYDVYGTYRRKKPLYNIYKAIYCDLSKEMTLDLEFDVVIHLASQIEVGNLSLYIDNTVKTTQNIISYCKRKKIKKLIYSSSIAVYGDCYGKVNENSDKINLDYYALTKYISEELLRNLDFTNVVILRLSRTLGKGVVYDQPWLPSLVKKLILGNDVIYYNPDLPYNNMCYIAELMDFIKLLIETNITGHEIIGTGSSREVSILEIISYLHKKLNSNSVLKEKKDNSKPCTCYSIDISKAISWGFMPREPYDILELFANDSIGYFLHDKYKE